MDSVSFLSTAYTVLAQAYGCGDYGEGTYNKCETDTSGGSSGSNGSGQGQGGDTPASSNNTADSPTTPSDSTTTPTDSSAAQEHTQEPTGTSSIPGANQVATTPWSILLPIILFLALLFAFLLFLWKRRHHDDEQPPTGGSFTPPNLPTT